MAEADATGAERLPPGLRTLSQAVRTTARPELSRMRPPPQGAGRASAVLVAFASADGTALPGRPAPGPAGSSAEGLQVLLIERASQLREHAGQVAFPGGASDPQDADRVDTALREAREEVGLEPADVQVLTELPELYIPRSNFVVTPVLAWLPTHPAVRVIDPGEVARVEFVPLAALADPAHRFRVRHHTGITTPGFEYEGMFVWGFTANVLDRLLEFGGWAQPWDHDHIRPLPQGRG